MGTGSTKRTASIDISPWQPPAKRASKSVEQLGAGPKYSLSSELEHQIASDEEGMSNEFSETDGKEDDEAEVLIYCQPVFYDN